MNARSTEKGWDVQPQAGGVRRHTLLLRAPGNRQHGTPGGGLKRAMINHQAWWWTPPLAMIGGGGLTGHLLIGVVAAALYGGAARLLLGSRSGRYQAGLDGERRCAQVLRRMPDVVICHDVMVGQENADHVLISRQGIFSIEVKNWAQVNVNAWGVTSRGVQKNGVLGQANRQAGKLAALTKTRVTPVVVFVSPAVQLRAQQLEGVHLTDLSGLPSTLTRLRRKGEHPLSAAQLGRSEEALKAQLSH